MKSYMIKFIKYQGLGNDFILVDRLDGGQLVTPEQAIRWCDRRRGVGADGVLTILPSKDGAARMHVTNADGSIAEMCGNGIRCAVKHLVDARGLAKKNLAVETGRGILSCDSFLDNDGKAHEISIQMGVPILDGEQIPLSVHGRFIKKTINVEGQKIIGTAVSMGNPHFVIFDLPAGEAALLGPKIERHELFPARTNVEFVHLTNDGGLSVTVWERGSGLTEACGTGACASMIAAVLENRLPAGEERPVRLPGGILNIRVVPDLSNVIMRGPAVRVFEGILTF